MLTPRNWEISEHLSYPHNTSTHSYIPHRCTLTTDHRTTQQCSNTVNSALEFCEVAGWLTSGCTNTPSFLRLLWVVHLHSFFTWEVHTLGVTWLSYDHSTTTVLQSCTLYNFHTAMSHSCHMSHGSEIIVDHETITQLLHGYHTTVTWLHNTSLTWKTHLRWLLNLQTSQDSPCQATPWRVSRQTLQ